MGDPSRPVSLPNSTAAQIMNVSYSPSLRDEILPRNLNELNIASLLPLRPRVPVNLC